MGVSAGWAKGFFRDAVFSPDQEEALAAAPREAAFAARALGLRRGSRVLDLCCGTGRHSVELARRGIDVLGVDATPAYLRRARAAARGLAGARFARGDMRRLSFRAEFDAVLNLWTSFGYFLDPAQDRRALEGVARALKPGGLFLLDVLNGGWLARHFSARNWVRRADGSVVLEENRLIGGRDPACHNTWLVLRPGRKPAKASLFVRVYSWERLSRELRAAGLSPVKRWGGLDGSPFGPDAKRLVVLARATAR